MRVLVIGDDPEHRSRVPALLASPGWRITRCATAAEAARVLRRARRPYDYILVEPDQDAGVEQTLCDHAPAAAGTARLIFLGRSGAEPRGCRAGVYGLYPLAAGGEEAEAGVWVLEYHAPLAPVGTRRQDS